MTGNARDLLACAAALLEQGRTIDRLSRPLTVAALVGIIGYAAAIGPPSLALAGLAIAVAVAGCAEAYCAVRVGFDAALFRLVANGPEAPDFAGTDTALMQLGLLPATKAGRPVEARIAGARRLFRMQVLALVLQVLLIAIAAGAAVTRG